MAAKYPSLAFTVRDIQDLLLELDPHVRNISIETCLCPIKADPARLRVLVKGHRRWPRLGETGILVWEVYVAGKGHSSLDKAVFQGLWKLWTELEVPSETFGVYTELVPGFRPR